MRLAFVACVAVLCGACGSEKASPDMMIAVEDAGADLSVADLVALPPDLSECKPGRFLGFPDVDVTETLACPCGCLIDDLQSGAISSSWSVVESANGLALPNDKVGVSLEVTSYGVLEFAGISSLSGVYPFYLDGDFELSVDYDMAELADNGRLRLIAQTQGGPPTGTFVVERMQDQSGTGIYRGLTGEVAAAASDTSATAGTLTLRRVGATFTAIADGTTIGDLSGGSVARMHIIITAGLASVADAGSTHTKAIVKNVRLTTGTLISKR